jgi:chemotaxis protein MotB
MKKITLLPLFAGIVLLLQITACVPYRKYQDALNARNVSSESSTQLKKELESSKKQLADKQTESDKLNQQLEALRRDTATLNRDYNKLLLLNREVTAALDRMKTSQAQPQIDPNLIANEARLQESLTNKERELGQKEASIGRLEGEIKALQAEIASLKSQNQMASSSASATIQQKEDALKLKEEEAKQKEAANAKLQAELQARETKVRELETVIKTREDQINALKSKIENALSGFKSNELNISERNGQIYVSLSQELLFASGSKTIDTKGKSAISKLGEVLARSQNDFNIVVEGHTDSDGDDKLNWDLSTGRAVTVTTELIKSGVDPKRVIASGRGEHMPVASNDTATGKAQNRRTEIILSPKSDKLLQLLDK